MKAATLARIALAAAAVLVAVILLTGGDDGYTLKLRMANTDGLKDGSPVTIGGVRIGTVAVDVDTKGDVAVATLKIKDRYAPLGRDTRATIVAQNVLGQKQVQLTKGSAQRQPAPSGYVVRADRIVAGTDLDRVLDVLDADTRTRLAIFLNEAGTAFTGRKQDFRDTLRDLGPAIQNTNPILTELADDSQSLEHLVQTADRYVASVTARKQDVTRLVDRVGQAAVTGATKRAQLRATLAAAPASLRTLKSFLAELRATTKPLGPAARQLSAVAAPLRSTLREVAPFTGAATPALRTATSIAPTLERLADRATPVLRRAAPTAAALRQTATTDLPPIFRLTDRALDNSLAVVENWAGAIQFRDGLSHIFRGEASVAPDALASVLERLAPKPAAKKVAAKATPQPAAGGGSASAGAPATPAPKLPEVKLPKAIQLPGLPPIQLPDVGKIVTDALGGLTGHGTAPKQSPSSVSALLDYLLGK